MGKVFGIIGLVSGIIGALVFWYIFGPIAIIFGAIGIAKDDSKGLGIAGLVLGTIDVACMVIFWLIFGTLTLLI